MNEACDTGANHGEAGSGRDTHMLEIGFANRCRVVGE